jgi:hypothetical protein
MVPTRLAFLQEFERDLDSISLSRWFESARKQDPALNEFIDPTTLREFLQTDERDPRKPQIWRALVRSFHIDPEPARLFILGLLEPALGHLIDKFAGDDLDEEDLWQETITCALAALSNPRLPTRPEVLAGLRLDTFYQLRRRLRGELSQARNAVPLLEEMPAPSRSQPRDTTDEVTVLARLCQRAGVGKEGFAVIRLTRLQQTALTALAPNRSPMYERLRRRRTTAERRIESWLTAHPAWPRKKKQKGLKTDADLTF